MRPFVLLVIFLAACSSDTADGPGVTTTLAFEVKSSDIVLQPEIGRAHV
jgi:hypothetical protein